MAQALGPAARRTDIGSRDAVLRTRAGGPGPLANMHSGSPYWQRNLAGVASPSGSQRGARQHVRRESQQATKKMKLPADAVISMEKLKNYLLTELPRGDKSRFPAQAGYTPANAEGQVHHAGPPEEGTAMKF